jgi:hypothetical protein
LTLAVVVAEVWRCAWHSDFAATPRASPATIGRYADTSIDGVQMGCPFCGNAARTKEQVWPRWLRRYGAYQVMSEGRSRQRFERSVYVLQRDSDNQLGEVVTDQRHVAEFLPDVCLLQLQQRMDGRNGDCGTRPT